MLPQSLHSSSVPVVFVVAVLELASAGRQHQHQHHPVISLRIHLVAYGLLTTYSKASDTTFGGRSICRCGIYLELFFIEFFYYVFLCAFCGLFFPFFLFFVLVDIVDVVVVLR